MARRRYGFLKVALPLLTLVCAVLAVGYLRATKPQIERTGFEERARPVAAATVEILDVQPSISAYGEVVAQRDVELRALVAGAVVAVGENFVNGGTVRAGDLLVAIDPFEYRAAVTEAEAALAEARAQLAETGAELGAEESGLAEDRTQLALAEREVARREALLAKGTAAQKTVDDALVRRSERARAVSATERRVAGLRARIARQDAVIARSTVALERAERDLENTRLTAPFDGYLTGVSAALGKRLGVNDRVVRLLDQARLDIRIHLSDGDYGRLVSSAAGLRGRPVAVTWRAGERSFPFRAVIQRADGEVDAASGGVRVYARIEDAGARVPLRPGAFVEVLIPDRVYRGAARLPETALVGGDTVYAVVDGRLEPRPVALLARVGNDVVVSGGIADGERIATTRFPEIGPGVKVQVR
ncbi:MAG: efflux RND transporter periplasmic adaptor subunit [Rhodospirillales bacterium]|nr:efflux RND transporter periplasmic adaptor subunit [Rhodospirillales bacterium]MDE0379177.1 efflux RND transporter periplasmic adaptor subunit [Rhodospirillales bacterium]